MTETNELKLSIASRLATARKNAGLSQGQAAKLMVMHRPTVSEIEAGRRNVTAAELTQFSEIYGVEVNWLSCSSDSIVDENRDRLMLAARELGKLKKDDFDKVIQLLSVMRGEEKKRS